MKLRATGRPGVLDSRPTMRVPTLASMPAVDLPELDELEELGPADEASDSGVYLAQFGPADVARLLGSLSLVPVVCLGPSELRSLPLDPGAAFLVGAIDGMTDIETLLDLAPMARDEALRSLCLLVTHGVVRVIE